MIFNVFMSMSTRDLLRAGIGGIYALKIIRQPDGSLSVSCPTVPGQGTTGRQGGQLPSLTPIWRSAELQEREIFDLYGIRFEGHPDLRRILMWDEFEDFPMRKDFREPDDYEYEPTPHDDVLEKAKRHYASPPQSDGAGDIAEGLKRT